MEKAKASWASALWTLWKCWVSCLNCEVEPAEPVALPPEFVPSVSGSILVYDQWLMLHPWVIKPILHFPVSLIFLEFILVSNGPVLKLGIRMTEWTEMVIKMYTWCNSSKRNSLKRSLLSKWNSSQTMSHTLRYLKLSVSFAPSWEVNKQQEYLLALHILRHAIQAS